VTLGGLLASGAAHAATFTVSTAADSGPGSLRQAITDVNATAGAPHVIAFTVTGAIDVPSPLPILQNAVRFAGPGAANLTIRRSVAATSAFSIFSVGAF